MSSSYTRKSVAWGALGLLLMVIGGVLTFFSGFSHDPVSTRVATGVLYAGVASIVVAFYFDTKATSGDPDPVEASPSASPDACERQRQAGVLFLLCGLALEAVFFYMPGRSIEGQLAARALAILGLALVSYTTTGSASPCLTALVPVPIAAPILGWFFSWLYGRLSPAARAARRPLTKLELGGLALALFLFAGGCAAFWRAMWKS